MSDITTKMVFPATGILARFNLSNSINLIKKKLIMEDSGKVVLGLLAGVALGATLGILFAPDKGERTRRNISSKVEDMESDLEDRFEDFLNDMKQKFNDVKKQAESSYEEEKHMAQNSKDKVSTAL